MKPSRSHSQTPSAAERIEVQFSDAPLTKRGGYGLLARFLSRLHVPDELAQLSPAKRPGARYDQADFLQALLYGSLLGCTRQTHIADLGRDAVLGELLGACFPSQPRLSTYLNQVSRQVAGSLRALNCQLVSRVRARRVTATVDLDATVISTRGCPEEAGYGYNPKRKGAQSYVAMVGYLGQTRDALDVDLYPGKCATISAERAMAAFERTRAALPEGVQRVRVRADAGYYSEAFLAHLESHQVRYSMAVRGSQGLKAKLPGLAYRALDDKWAVAELTYQAPSASRPRRLVVVREKLEPDHRGSKQLRLLSQDGYGFQVIVTSLRDEPEQVWRDYNQRCRAENLIREQQEDFGLDHVLCRSFAGNLLWLQIVALAYNVMNWFRELILGQKAHRNTARLLRKYLFELPGRLVHSGRRVMVKANADAQTQACYRRARSELQVFHL